MWQEGLTSGNGWIALALVVFATWPRRGSPSARCGSGGVSALGLYLQAVGVHVSTFALSSLPYLATVLVCHGEYISPPADGRRHAPDHRSVRHE